MSNGHNKAINTNKPAQSLGASTPELLVSSLSTSFKNLRVDKPASAASGEPVLSFLHLPPEIRLAIYEVVLVDNIDSTAILQICRQINMEAHEVLYQRPSSFNTQAKLFAWIERSRIANLNRVRKITLRLTDVDLTSLLETPSSKRQTRTTVWSLYKDDLQKLEQSLSTLPNLSSLTIIPPKICHSHLLKNMYHTFLSEIPRRCPRLKRLEIYDSDNLLDTVPALKDVRHVTFTASSSKASVESKEDRGDSRMGSDADPELSKKESSRPSGSITARHSTWVRTVLG